MLSTWCSCGAPDAVGEPDASSDGPADSGSAFDSGTTVEELPDAGSPPAGDDDAGSMPPDDTDAGAPGTDAGVRDAGSPAEPSLPQCPQYGARVKSGELTSTEMRETSGVVVSRKNPGVLWAHNDSGDSPRLFAVNAAGKLLGIYHVGGGAQAHDWEDLGLVQLGGVWHLVVGDIGGNSGRHSLQVYFVAEPSVALTQSGGSFNLTPARTLHLDYPGTEQHNAESLFVDPLTQELYLVTKATSGVSDVMRKAPPHVDGATTVLSRVATLDFSAAPLGGDTTTAADVSADGRAIIIKTYTTMFLFRRVPGATVAQALSTAPCVLPQAPGETIAFTPDAKALFSIAEGVGATVFRYDRN
ncbi:MAG: hypothetical protein IPJ65_39470 [Archangiaceae bacterium]|nr:hypothetical protein [Archangiaceae bacterium]